MSLSIGRLKSGNYHEKKNGSIYYNKNWLQVFILLRGQIGPHGKIRKLQWVTVCCVVQKYTGVACKQRKGVSVESEEGVGTRVTAFLPHPLRSSVVPAGCHIHTGRLYSEYTALTWMHRLSADVHSNVPLTLMCFLVMSREIFAQKVIKYLGISYKIVARFPQRQTFNKPYDHRMHSHAANVQWTQRHGGGWGRRQRNWAARGRLWPC